MTSKPIKAVTFDLWDTVIHDDSDEPKRAAQGLRTKAAERRHLVWQALDRIEPISLERVTLAYDVAEAAFRKTWHEQYVTWPVPERIEIVLAGLKRSLPDEALAEVARGHEEMELEVAPDPIEGVAEAIAALASAGYKLGVVSDAIVSPGRCLRRWLGRHGLLDHFSAFAFSDEVGRSKPHRAMFDAVADGLGVAVEELVHIGDRDHNDIKGAQAVGARAILFVATRDRDRDTTTADAICDEMRQLPGLIEQLAQG